MARSVLFLGYPGVQGLDVVGPFEVFAAASTYLATKSRDGYQPVLATLHGQPATTATGLTFAATTLPDPRQPVDTVVLPGGRGVHAARQDPQIIAWIQAVAKSARRVASVCTGTFLAAQAGLLDGCTATTHWASADRLAREFPSITVDPEPIFVRSSATVWTAAGVTAGIDLALSLVEDDHGTDVAQTVARWLVLYLRRPGGQTQFAAPVWMPRARREPIRGVQDVIESEPGGTHSVTELGYRAGLPSWVTELGYRAGLPSWVTELARRAGMSARHFTRVFTDEVGEPPGAYVERIRIDAARRQLEETDDTVVAIAARCGFGSSETMRRNFVRRVGISPDQYRKTFA